MALVTLSSARNTGDRSLQTKSSSYRLARSVETNPGKDKKKKKQAKKSKNRSKSRKATKKAKKAKKARKIKKDKKTKKKKSRKSKKKKASQGKKNRKNKRGRVNSNCFEIAVDALYKGVAKKASNFDRQSIRIETRTPIIANKLKKAGDYADFASELNTTVDKCSEGSIDPDKAKGVVEVLNNCKDQITKACAAPEVDQKQIDKCKIIVKAFKEGTELCFAATMTEDKAKACECWEGEEYAKLVGNLTGCVINESVQKVSGNFKECKGAVQTCNIAQRNAALFLLKCTGAGTTTTEESTTAETLKKNIKALGEAKVAVKAVAGTTNTTSAAANRTAETRSEGRLTCPDFTKLIKKCEL